MENATGIASYVVKLEDCDKTLTNNATLTFTYAPGRKGNVTDNASVDIICDCSINLTKIARPSSAPPLSNITFVITVTNSCDSVLEPVVVKDSLPQGLDYKSSNRTGIRIGQNIIWNLTRLKPGQSNFIELIAQINKSASGTLWNQAKSVGILSDGDNVTANDTVPVNITAANISVEKTASPSVAFPLTNVRFVIRVTNTGDSDLGQVVVDDSLPAGLDYVSDNRTGTRTGQNIIWNLSRLEPGQSCFIELIAQINKSASGASLWNQVKTSGVPPSGDNVSSKDKELVIAVPIPPPVDNCSRCITSLIFTVPVQRGKDCCCDCCTCPSNATNYFNITSKGQSIQVVTIGPANANVSNLSQKTNNSSNKYNEIKS
jgi:uncharacterized repeat protein (TIGR01451 family)